MTQDSGGRNTAERSGNERGIHRNSAKTPPDPTAHIQKIIKPVSQGVLTWTAFRGHRFMHRMQDSQRQVQNGG